MEKFLLCTPLKYTYNKILLIVLNATLNINYKRPTLFAAHLC